MALLARRSDFSSEHASELPSARAYSCDVGDAASVTRAFASIRAELGDVDVVIYNAGSGAWGTIEEVTPEAFETNWRVNALGAFLVGKEVIAAMKGKGSGAFVFVGAVTFPAGGSPRPRRSRRQRPRSAASAESMARHLWPSGIHVALIVLDGVVDLPATRQRMPGKPDAFFVRPADVADLAFRLTQQPRSAWSFEVEARPFGETW